MSPPAAASPDEEDPAPPGSPGDFAQLASRLGILSLERAQELTRAASAAGVTAVEYGLMKTILQPADADILRTLLDPHQAIPGYEIVNVLGRGGMGVVYRARQRSLDRQVALKTILLSQLANPVAAQRFEQEARSLARLAHPHIIAVYDLGRVADRLYFAMELVEGEDVERLVRRHGALEETLAWQLIRQAAAGLAHAANAGIVHRDVKPANLLLVSPPEGSPLPAGTPLVKIADFGLALLNAAGEESGDARLTSEDVHVGSPIYMAPEQIRSGTVDHRADIFSLGITAWQMLVGHPPPGGKNLTEILARRLTTPTEPVTEFNSSVSGESSQLVAAMLHPDPERRLGDYDSLLAEIDHVLNKLEAASDPTQTRIGPKSSVFGGMPGMADRLRRPVPVVLAETVPAAPRQRALVNPDGETGRSNRRTWLWGVTAAAVLGLSVAAWKFSPKPRAVRELVPDGAPIPIFNGESLMGWTTLSGGWRPGTDDEGGRVLIGENGAIAFHPPGVEEAIKHEHFRFELTVDVRDAEFAEIETDFSPSDARRLVVRLSKAGVTIGQRAADRGEFDKTFPVVGGFDLSRGVTSVALERQPAGWWILVDGEVAGVVPHGHATVVPDLHLGVKRGTARFADLLLEMLVPRR